MKIKTAIITIIAIIIGNTVGAQQAPVFSEYSYNTFLINSAYAGLYNDTEMSLSYSSVLNAFEGSPRALSLTVNAPLKSKKIGVGGGYISNQVGYSTSNYVFGAYSYKIYFDKNVSRYQQSMSPSLSMGISAGIEIFQNLLSKTQLPEQDNAFVDLKSSIPSVGIGFLYSTPSFFAGISTPNVIGDTFASGDKIQLENPYFAYLGYQFYTNEFKHFLIKPNFLFKYEMGAPMQADLNLSIRYKGWLEVGGGYRTTSDTNFLLGIYAFKNFRFVYNYSLGLNKSLLGNRHGFILNYRLGDGYSDN